MRQASAGFWPRAAAFGLDYLVICAYIAFLVLATWLASLTGISKAFTGVFTSLVLFDLFAFCTLTLPVILYFTLSECSEQQGTWGKRIMHLRVTDLEGERIGLARSLARSALKFLPWQIAHTSLFHIPGWPLDVQEIPTGPVIGFGIVWFLALSYLFLLAFDKLHRTPYDWLSGTMVERIKSS